MHRQEHRGMINKIMINADEALNILVVNTKTVEVDLNTLYITMC